MKGGRDQQELSTLAANSMDYFSFQKEECAKPTAEASVEFSWYRNEWFCISSIFPQHLTPGALS